MPAEIHAPDCQCEMCLEIWYTLHKDKKELLKEEKEQNKKDKK